MRVLGRTLGVVMAILALSRCATAPPPAPPPPPPVAWEQKLSWILRLEDQRVLRDPAPPPVAAPPVAPARARAPAAPPPPAAVPDLIALLADGEARVRRRAALAIGRVGLSEGAGPLVARLTDPDPEVREMVAFALGLIGDRAALDPLVKALQDPDGRVQGRAAEALGSIGAAEAAGPIGAMVAAKVQSGAVGALAVDDLRHPLEPPVEAFRLGLYALVRLKAWDALAAAVLDGAGQPRVSWWPVAYALQRIEDPRAVPALVTFARGHGVDAVAFAARGLGVLKASSALDTLVALLDPATHDLRVVAQAARALGQTGDRRAAAALLPIAIGSSTDPNVRLEAVTALGVLQAPAAYDPLLNLVAARWPPLRGAVLRALAAIDPEAFMAVLSTLDVDPAWTVRAELASILGTLGPERASDKLLAMLKDPEPKVLPAVLEALAQVGADGADEVLIAQLEADDAIVRATASRLLGTRKAARAAAALARALERAAGDATYSARTAALDALAAIDPAGARARLVAALHDKDWAVRRFAANRLRQLEPGADVSAMRPAPTGRDADFYERASLVSPPYSPQAYIDTSKGSIQLELNVVDSPLTTDNFVTLARKGFFNGIAIHRVVPNFVVQDGDPRGDGEGGPGYTVRDELGPLPYLRGTAGMALEWRDTAGSQFFITHGPQPHLDGRYTVFGRVVAGMEIVDRLTRGDVIERVRIWDGVEFR